MNVSVQGGSVLAAVGQAGPSRESRRVCVSVCAHVCVLESVFVLSAARRFGNAPGSPGRQGEQRQVPDRKGV